MPAGDGWTVDPFGGLVRDGKIYGRGVCDMKAGIAAAVFAAEAIARAGVTLPGTIEISGTVDEESGGFAGVAYLAERGRIAKGRTDYVIIPEPLNVDRICIGHRGVYWFEVTARGRIGHGSMPFLGVSAIDGMGRLAAVGARRSDAVAGVAAHRGAGGAAGRAPRDDQRQRHRRRPADRRHPDAVRRRSLPRGVRSSISDRGRLRRDAKARSPTLVERVAADAGGVRFDMRDLMVVHPARTPDDSPVIARARARRSSACSARRAELIASPGTYDHKHVARIAGIPHCVAYGPGELELAHQPDESCRIDDIVNATKVLALATLDLMGAREID